jgi:hypothetical protein
MKHEPCLTLSILASFVISRVGFEYAGSGDEEG